MEIEAIRGRPFELSVEQYGTSGYVWEVESAPAGARRIDDSGEPGGAGVAPGSPRTRTFRFVAEEEGDFEIVLAARRAWEAEPAERRVYRIRVGPGG